MECNIFVNRELPGLTMVTQKTAILLKVVSIHALSPVLKLPLSTWESHMFPLMRPRAEAGMQQAHWSHWRKNEAMWARNKVLRKKIVSKKRMLMYAAPTTGRASWFWRRRNPTQEVKGQSTSFFHWWGSAISKTWYHQLQRLLTPISHFYRLRLLWAKCKMLR